MNIPRLYTVDDWNALPVGVFIPDDVWFTSELISRAAEYYEKVPNDERMGDHLDAALATRIFWYLTVRAQMRDYNTYADFFKHTETRGRQVSNILYGYMWAMRHVPFTEEEARLVRAFHGLVLDSTPRTVMATRETARRNPAWVTAIYVLCFLILVLALALVAFAIVRYAA